MTQTPIAAAVEPLRSAAVEHAKSVALEYVLRFTARAPVGIDLNTVFPFPNGNMSKAEYRTTQARYGLASRLFEFTRDPIRIHAPRIVTGVREAAIARFVAEAAESAEFEFTAYVAKLEAKIGKGSVSASVAGNRLWEGSTLSVTFEDGRKENWRTTQILNVSSLGKVFHQWPTRLLKPAK